MTLRHWKSRAQRLLGRFCPDSLFGQLVIILAVGMFSSQLITSSIWWQSRDHRTLEIPVRLFASRLADTVRLLDGVSDPTERQTIISRLSDTRYRLRLATPEEMRILPPASQSIAQRTVADLLNGVIRRRLGTPIDVTLLGAHLRGDDGRHHGPLALFDSRMPTGYFHVVVHLPNGDALDVLAEEGQAGMQEAPFELLFDFLFRLYFIRLLAVFIVAFIAVRIAVRPLKHFADSAKALGKNIYRPPLPLIGPREVREAAASMNAMQTLLIESIATRTRFLAAISHDLRSPLTRLRLRVEMLPLPEWREKMRVDIDDMESMVRATLHAVQGIEITEKRCDIDIDSMLDGLAEDAREAGHSVTVSGTAGPPIQGYPRSLKRCLQNLIDNAIRYGNEADVFVESRVDALCIVIADRGPGIADSAMLERVFDAYFRLKSPDVPSTEDTYRADGSTSPARSHARSKTDSGTGLGLTIARAIAEAHNGTLTLRNRMGGGLEGMLVLRRR